MGKKLNSKNHLTPAPPPIANLSSFGSKINKNKGMILGKFRSEARPGTRLNRLLKFQWKSIIKECENGIKISNFKIFFIYTLYRCILLANLKSWFQPILINNLASQGTCGFWVTIWSGLVYIIVTKAYLACYAKRA